MVTPTTLVTDDYGEARFDWVLGDANSLTITSDDGKFTGAYNVTLRAEP